jgi:2-haloacid dehalogenase
MTGRDIGAAGRDIGAVVFDIGGVLLDWDPRHLYRQLIDDPVEMADFLARVCTPQWHLAHDLGADTEQSCRDLARMYPDYEQLIMAWTDRDDVMIAGPLTDVVEVLAELRAAGVRCLALSNMEPDRFVARKARFPFLRWFDGYVISGIEGVAKPDRRIFEILLTRYELEPGATVFVDDADRNVQAARQLGIAAVRYNTPDQLRRDLRGFGLDVQVRGRAAN